MLCHPVSGCLYFQFSIFFSRETWNRAIHGKGGCETVTLQPHKSSDLCIDIIIHQDREIRKRLNPGIASNFRPSPARCPWHRFNNSRCLDVDDKPEFGIPKWILHGSAVRLRSKGPGNEGDVGLTTLRWSTAFCNQRSSPGHPGSLFSQERLCIPCLHAGPMPETWWRSYTAVECLWIQNPVDTCKHHRLKCQILERFENLFLQFPPIPILPL